MLIMLLNGCEIQIQGIGQANLFSQIISNVLYMSTFTSNLLYVNKITNQLNCNVIFPLHNVIFEYRITGKKISEGKIREWTLYIRVKNTMFF